MGRKKLDNRIRTVIENGVKSRHRSMFVVIGDKSTDQVVTLHNMLTKASLSSKKSVLWCYKEELEFTSHRKKRMQEIKKKIEAGIMHARVSDLARQSKCNMAKVSNGSYLGGGSVGVLHIIDTSALLLLFGVTQDTREHIRLVDTPRIRSFDSKFTRSNC